MENYAEGSHAAAFRDYLTSAEAELMLALATVRAVRDRYDNLPVIVEEYHQAAE